jgi:hypothetical protein
VDSLGVTVGVDKSSSGLGLTLDLALVSLGLVSGDSCAAISDCSRLSKDEALPERLTFE